uniref:Uncharacterized protein n=1 Tax=Hemiselmis tepida TaxID=464990 RepID=A0A7S0W5K2_9CRYP|mmetsp:Transcript_4967/g.12698  ORF Transcript_4967/g.12698 Transcript_4967/m.12698 type:complete len:204 (+) Transcript_4967:70-681(+)
MSNKFQYENALLGNHRHKPDELATDKSAAARPKRLMMDLRVKILVDSDVSQPRPRRMRRSNTKVHPNSTARAVYKSDFDALVSDVYRGEGGRAAKGVEGAARRPLWERRDAEEQNMFVARPVPKRGVMDCIVIGDDAQNGSRGSRRPVTAFDPRVFHSLHAPHSTPRSSRNRNLVRGYDFFPKKKDAAFWSATKTRTPLRFGS